MPGPVMRQLLCHPEQQALVHGFRALCPVCGSFWDLEACAGHMEYTDAYPLERMHFDPQVGNLKVSSLKQWLSTLNLDPRHDVACEVGFGGGYCLAHLRGFAQEVFGLEAVPANIAHAHSLGVPSSCLFSFHERPRVLPRRVSLWLFLDSFEHILELDTFMPWLVENASDRARLLIVAPDANSLSQRYLGRFWPHKLAEHLFHWSSEGLAALCQQYGFTVRRRFKPTKHISTDMVVNHLQRTPLRWLGLMLGKVIPPCEVWFNVGEMGFLLDRV